MERVKELITKVLQWWKQLRIARALTRYSSGLGGQLSGGIALTGLLSVAAALTIALTAMTGVFKRHPDFRDVVFDQINEMLPGVIATGGQSGMVTPEQLQFSGGWNLTGIIAGLVLLNTATVVMATLRTALRSMFGLHNAAESFVFGKLRDLAAFLALAVSVLLTSLLAVGARTAYDWLQSHIGHWAIMPDSKLALQAATFGIALIVDSLVFGMLFRGLAGARVPWSQLWRGCLLGAVGTGALRYLGASVVVNLADKPLLASVAAVATLLLWLNFAARITLLVAAWTADPPQRPKLSRDALPHMNHTPNYVSVSAPETLQWDYGVYSGLVQPQGVELPGATDEARGPNDGNERRRDNGSDPRRAGDDDSGDEDVGGEAVGGEAGGAEPAGPEPAGPEPTGASDQVGPPPLIRTTPDSPLGRAKAQMARRRRGTTRSGT